MTRLAVILSLFLIGSLLRAAEPVPYLDDPGKLLPADTAWAGRLEGRLAAFERTAGTKIVLRLHLKSPSAEEDNEPGAYMRGLATKLGVIGRGVLVVYFADDPDWRVWIGDELAPAFVGRAGTAQEFTASGAMHEAKEAFLGAAFTKADAAFAALPKGTPAQRLACRADALVDGLIDRLTPPGRDNRPIPAQPVRNQ